MMLIALILFAASNVTPILDVSRPARMGVFLLSIAATGILSAIPVMALRWLDRREPEPWFMYAPSLRGLSLRP